MKSINGPNVYHPKAVVIMRLELEQYTEVTTADLRPFPDKLAVLLPGITQHHCSPRRPGGFMERMFEGTYLGHVIEHVALELSEKVGIPVNYGKTLTVDAEKGVYHVVVRS